MESSVDIENMVRESKEKRANVTGESNEQLELSLATCPAKGQRTTSIEENQLTERRIRLGAHVQGANPQPGNEQRKSFKRKA